MHMLRSELDDVRDAERRHVIVSRDVRVYYALAFHADSDGKSCFPSEETLANWVVVASAETIRRSLRSLEHAGLVVVTRKWDKKTKRTRNFYFLPARAAAFGADTKRKGAAE